MFCLGAIHYDTRNRIAEFCRARGAISKFSNVYQFVTFETQKRNGKKSKNKITAWNEHLDKKYGTHGTATRSEFELKAQSFIFGELLKDEREKANLTQAEMAEKTGMKKSYISRIENGRADIQLSTL